MKDADGKYPQRTCGCGRPMTPRVYTNGVKETPRAFAKRKGCDKCSPMYARPRHFCGNVSGRTKQQEEANQVLQSWQ